MKKHLLQLRDITLLGLAAIPIGAVIGLLEGIFGRGLILFTGLRGKLPVWFILFLPLGGLLIAYLYSNYGKGGASRGMEQVFDVDAGRKKRLTPIMIPLCIVGTWITHLFGGSSGREGAAVQIGAVFSHYFGRRVPIRNATQILMVAGMAAGFSGLFRTPIASALFAMEIMVAGAFRFRAMFPALLASYTSYAVSGLLGLKPEAISMSVKYSLNAGSFIKLILLGFFCGLAGALFSLGMHKAKHAAKHYLPNPYLRIAVMGLVTAVLLVLFKGRYSGSGANLIEAAFEGHGVKLWDGLLKGCFTALTLSAGFQGGEITTLFTIGATTGAILAGPLGLPVALAAGLGYAAVFSSGTNSYFAPLLISIEIFGGEYLPFFFIAVTVAYVFNRDISIYPNQRMLYPEED